MITTTELAESIARHNGRSVGFNVTTIRRIAPPMHLSPAVTHSDPADEVWSDDDADEITMMMEVGP